MDLPVELVGFLKHAGVDGKKLTWDLHASAVSVKLIWIKAEISIAKTGEVASQAQKKKYLSGNETLNASISGRRKGMKLLVTIKYTLKHRQTIVTPT